MPKKKKTPGKPVTIKKEKKTPGKLVKAKEPTLKEKIDKTVEHYVEDKEELKKQIFGLIQRVLYPDQFCPKCKDRLFLGPTGWSCPNCGYQGQSIPQATAQPAPRPSQTGKVPPQVEKMIQSTKEPRRVVSPTKRGKNIRKLVDQMNSGGPSAPTHQDEAMVKRDKNVSRKINWV